MLENLEDGSEVDSVVGRKKIRHGVEEMKVEDEDQMDLLKAEKLKELNVKAQQELKDFMVKTYISILQYIYPYCSILRFIAQMFLVWLIAF